jgi:hypothetical protein
MSSVSQQPVISGSLAKLIDVLQQVNTSASNAGTNAISISDNNGGRIIL